MKNVTIINAVDTSKANHPVDTWPVMMLEVIKDSIDNCKFIDTRFENINIKKTINEIFFIHFIAPDFRFAIDLCKKIKNNDSKNIIVAIGPLPSLYPNKVIFDSSPVDYVLAGEIELVAQEFIKKLKKGKQNIKLDCLVSQNKKKYKLKMIDDLNKIKIPKLSYEYRCLYPIKGFFRAKHGFILSSRGCKHNCSFCSPISIRVSFGKKFRTNSINHIIDEIKYNIKRGCNIITFMDDDFTSSKGRIIELCSKIIKDKIKIKWIAHARIDEIDNKLLYLMKKAGCVILKIGVESGSERMLLRINKTKHPKKWIIESEKLFNYARKINLDIVAMFMIGIPDETNNDLNKTKKLIKQLNPYLIQLAKYTSYYDLLKKDIYPRPSVYHYKYDKKLKKIERELYKTFYMRLPFLKNHIRYVPYYILNPRLAYKLIRYLI
jgi:radical SAM superfamily enzyme YgiQ (UPF0313 family)